MNTTPLHVACLSTLFPDATRPNFAIFVERSMAALGRQPGVELSIIAPVGIPPWPLSLHPRYAALRDLPLHENWHGLDVYRPRFSLIPGVARRNAAAVARAAMPIAAKLAALSKMDVIQAQFFWPDGRAAALIANSLDVPLSIKARGSDISYWAQRPDILPAILSAAASADGILAVAHSLKADMVALGINAEHIEVHYTGLDATRFRPLERTQARAEWGLADGVPVILTVGAVIQRKGQALVIAAMAHLPPDCLYLIAGSGDCVQSFSEMAKAAGLADRVRFLGGIAHDRLPSLYAAADVMALPSASEGLANVWVEALACGTPLLLGDIAPAHELVDAPDAGRIVAREAGAIARGIIAILADPPDRGVLSARTHARFDWERHGRELAAHLRSLVQKHEQLVE